MTGKSIIFFLDSLGVGGAEHVAVSLANQLYNKNYNINFLILNNKNIILSNEIDNSVEISYLGVSSTKNALISLMKYCRNEKPDMVVVFHYQIALALILLKVFRLIPKTDIVVRNVSTLSVRLTQGKSIWARYVVGVMLRVFYRYADGFIAQSQGMKDDLIRNFAVPADKITVINNPVADRFLSAQTIDKKNEILCVGRLEAVKNFDHVIQVMPTLLKKHPDFKLVIVGDGSYRQAWEDAAKAAGVSQSVMFEGMQNDLVPYYARARATILTSTYEGFPNVLLESVACGTPVVAYDCPSGPAEIISGKKNGLLVDYMNQDDLLNKILYALEHDWDAQEIKRTAAKYHPNYIIKQYEDYLQKWG